MPEYHLPLGDKVDSFFELPPFVQGYIEAAFFCDANADQDERLDGAGFADLDPGSLSQAIADCERFQSENAADLAQALERDYTLEQAGRDFWFTRNHHGVGFWDRQELDADGLGERLTAAAHKFPERYLGANESGPLIVYID